METFEVMAVLVTAAAVFAYINHRLLKLPATIGLMGISLAAALALLVLRPVFPGLAEHAGQLVASDIDFSKLLLEGMLGFLLFAGALHIDLNDLASNKWSIGTFATVGVVGSTFLIGGAAYLLSMALSLGLTWLDCLLFGALISPTDPIAVLGILRKVGAPKNLEVKITGESLFNDGIGVVVFLTLLRIAGGDDMGVGGVAVLFAKEALGGLLFGLAAGYTTYRLLKSVNNYQVEVLLTLALVVGGYALAARLHVSAPIAIVAAGLLIGNHGRRLAMSEKTRHHLDTFWELIDEILNAVLFVLIGLEVLVVSLSGKFLLAGALAVPLVLLGRLLSVGGVVRALAARRPFMRGATGLLTWGGLRGGISVALALSLPDGPARDVILTMTYVVVAFSVLVQGLTIGPLVRRAVAKAEAASSDS